MNVLCRFMSRRGQILHLYSDNGSNFIGAEQLLCESLHDCNQNQLHTFFLQKDIQWSFNPRSASQECKGGAWERMIKSVQRILQALVKEKTLNDDQLQTFLLEAEAILNARPLTPATLDVDGEMPLTPNHLLRVNAAAEMPPAPTHASDRFSKQRWRNVQLLADQFWKRWSREYLRTIISRHKWHHTKRNFKVNDVVLLVDNNTPQAQWSMGRVGSAHLNEHGIVQTVSVKCHGS